MWAEPAAASAFFNAMRQSLQSRYKGAIAPPGNSDSSFRITGGGRSVILARTHGDRGVSLVDAADAPSAESLRSLLLASAGAGNDRMQKPSSP
jgi:hypothetical protein